jgi:hypothetical protein
MPLTPGAHDPLRMFDDSHVAAEIHYATIAGSGTLRCPRAIDSRFHNARTRINTTRKGAKRCGSFGSLFGGICYAKLPGVRYLK